MKKLILAVALACTGCGQEQTTPITNNNITIQGYDIKTATYEGCEYLIVGSGNGQMMSHKGNCSNPIHNQVKNP